MKKQRKVIEIDKETKDFYDKYIGKITCAYASNVYADSEGKERCNAKRTEEREKYLFKGLTEDIVLIECPLDMLAIEFEKEVKVNINGIEETKKASPEQIKDWLQQTKKNAESHKIESCIASHGGTSDYFYACNLTNLIENKEKECKKELAKIIVPKEAWDFLDKSNLGSTLIPIINRPHWKIKKYNGEIHKIIEGKHPLKQKNKIPDIVLQRVFDNERPNFENIKVQGDSDINSIPLTSIISTSGLKKKGQEYQGANVWHGSGTGMNFCINPSKNIWHCFRHNCGGGVAKAIALNRGIISNCDDTLTSSQFKEVLEIARNEYGLKKPEIKDSPTEQMINGRFIFDSSKIVNPATFSCHKIGDSFGYGLLLPKEVPIFEGKGDERKIVGRRQIRSPVVITSKGEIIEPSPETESKFKIKYVAIPNELDLRIETEILQKFLKSEMEKINAKELFEEMKKEGYNKFLFFQNPLWYDIHILWDIGTYFFELFTTYPLMEMRGLSGSAKSKVMKVSKLYTLNPTEILVNPSEASLFRITHTNRPTKYIDEAEKLFLFVGGQWQSSPIVELINGSYTKGSSVPRLEKVGNGFKLVSYQCYSPTMIGSIAGLRDATETRAITHIMTKAPDKDDRGQLEVEDFARDELYQKIRNKLYLFAWQNWEQIEKTYVELKVTKLKKRDLQLWKPILTIAKVIDNEIYDNVLAFAEKLSKQRKEDFIPEGTLDYILLKKLKEFIELKKEPIRIKDITNCVNLTLDKKVSGKTVSSHFDKLGFKEFRTRDEESSILKVNEIIFETIVNPICPTLSTDSTYSPLNKEKEVENNVEDMVNNGESSKEHNNPKMVNLANNGENGESIEISKENQTICQKCGKEARFNNGGTWLCRNCYYGRKENE